MDVVQESLNRAADEVTPEDRKDVIAELRRQRAKVLAGGKATKPKEDVDITKLGIPELQRKPPNPTLPKGRRC
jgi:hypothetical protein